jgi:hypothetical protein
VHKNNSPQNLLPLEPPHELIYVVQELVYGGAKGSYGVPVGVRDPPFGRGTDCVLRQGVDLIWGPAPTTAIRTLVGAKQGVLYGAHPPRQTSVRITSKW